VRIARDKNEHCTDRARTFHVAAECSSSRQLSEISTKLSRVIIPWNYSRLLVYECSASLAPARRPRYECNFIDYD